MFEAAVQLRRHLLIFEATVLLRQHLLTTEATIQLRRHLLVTEATFNNNMIPCGLMNDSGHVRCHGIVNYECNCTLQS